MYNRRGKQPTPQEQHASDGRVRVAIFKGGVVLAICAVVLRLFVLQVLSSDMYTQLAADQHQSSFALTAKRGVIYVHDSKSQEGLFPVAVNKTVYTVFANGKQVEDPKIAATALAPLLNLDQAELEAKLNAKDDPYIPLAKQVGDEAVTAIKASGLKGFGYEPQQVRFYPEKHLMSHVLGFVSVNDEGVTVGNYGIEGRWNKELSGRAGYESLERDPLGQLISIADRTVQPADNGADMVLTIDRTIQYVACEKLRAAVEKHQADSGSVVIVEPKTGKILALCSMPDYDPNEFSKVTDLTVFNNTGIFTPYESGSIFKPVTMAAAIDAGGITPGTTYVDEGKVELGPYTIRNSDGKANGEQTMTQVLEKSLNTGTIFAAQQIGPDVFRDYVEKFGFGKEHGIELQIEASGNIGALNNKGEIWTATASYGQGITMTPLQLAMAYAAIANGGRLMQPYIVDELRMPDGLVVKTEPKVVRQVISRRTAELVSGMMVGVVENGHGKRAGVKGYYVAGKTGTAQIPRKDGRGYEAGPTIGSFGGFAPVSDPAFVMITKIERPKDVTYAELSAAPLFGEIADFLVHYLQIPPERQ